MRRGNSSYNNAAVDVDEAGHGSNAYLTYRPLSNLPTPPPTSKDTYFAQSPDSTLFDGESLKDGLRGPAVHLVNLIPSAASLATASVPLVQAILTRAALPLETVAFAVCILDSLDAKFGRTWRISCPLRPDALTSYFTPSSSKRHTLPPSPLLCQQQQRHIDAVSPEIIVLAALVIAVKFTEDPQQPTQFYCAAWGRDLWTNEQFNITERCIMASLEYRIMPLYDDDYLADAMVDMQLAGQQVNFESRELTPPENLQSNEDFLLRHSRSKTMGPVGKGCVRLDQVPNPAESP